MLNSQDIAFFTVIANSRSLAAAARKLNVTPPNVSQRLQHLEEKLKVKLVERTTRALMLTSAGELLLKEGLIITEALTTLNEQVMHAHHELSGAIKVIAPVGLGIRHIGEISADFQLLHPSVTIDLQLSDTPKWTVGNKPDLLFYIGHLADSSLTRVVIAKNRRLLLASPHYINQGLKLSKPSELIEHKCLALVENEEDATMWRFTHEKTKQDVSVRIAPHLSSNIGQVVKDWCLGGHGIMQRSEWDIKQELNSGELVQLLPEYRFADADIVALLSTSQSNRPAKIQAYLDYVKMHLVERLQQS